MATGKFLRGFFSRMRARVSSRSSSRPDLFALLVLRRVRAGEIQATDRGYVGLAGRPVHRDLARELERLRKAGYVFCAAADTGGRSPVELTAVGIVVLGEWEEGDGDGGGG